MKISLRSIWNSLTGFAPKTEVVRTPAGVDVSVYDTSLDEAIKLSTVYSAVKLISEGVARLALEYQRYNSARGCFVDFVDDALYTTLRIRPNASLTAFDLWRATIQQVLLQGNAYIYPYPSAANPQQLILLSPYSTYYDATNALYNVNDTTNGIYGQFRHSEIIHLKNIGIDGGLTGLSTISLAAQDMGILRLANRNTAATLSNGGRIRGLLSGDTGLATFGAPSTQQLSDVSTGVENDIRDGRTVIPVPPEMKFMPITLSPADAKVLESKQFTIRDIARFFRVHPDLLYEGSNNTYKAAEVPNVMFLTQTLEPLLSQIEMELLVKLVPQQLWGRRRIRFDREALYITDLATEAQYLEAMLRTGVYTVNELRARKGRAPIEGGDTLLISANLRTTEENSIKNGEKENGN